MCIKIDKFILRVLNKYFLLLALGVITLAVYNIFYHLDADKVWDWDEARAGVTAYEMFQNHNFVVSTFGHQTDLWNLKPPLGTWLILLGYKIFGFNVFALRFFSAFCCLLSVIVIIWIMFRTAGKTAALLSGFILATTQPLIVIHGARSGDYSSFLTLLALLFIVCLFKSETKTFFFYLAGIVFSLSFLVYSFAAFQLLILALVYWGIVGDYRRIPLKKYFVFLLCAFLPIVAWAIWRFLNADGLAFLRGMISYDLINRTIQTLESHAGKFDYYLTFMFKEDSYWSIFMLVILVSCLAVFGFKWNLKNRFFVLSVLGIIVPLVLFSIARTKLVWYVLPVFPPLAIATGWLMWFLLNDRRCQNAGKIVFLVFFLIVGLRSEREIQKRINKPELETAQNILNDFKKTSYPPNSSIYRKGWTQATFFVAEVVCGLNPLAVKDISECLNCPGFLMLERGKKNTESENFVVAHRLAIVLQNGEWMIVKL